MRSEAYPPRESLDQSLHAIRQLRRSAWFSSALMCFGVVITIVSFAYSFTRLRPLEDRLSVIRLEYAEVNRQLDTAIQRKVLLDKAVSDAQKQLDATKNELDLVQKELLAVKTSPSPDGAHKDLDKAIGHLKEIQNAVSATDAQLRATAPSKPTSSVLSTIVGWPGWFGIILGNERQRTTAEKVREELAALGFQVALNPRLWKWRTDGFTQVRYFRNPEDKNIAESVAEFLRNVHHVPNVRLAFIASAQHPPKKLEIWLDPSFVPQ